jgi:hypothetical protein
MLTRAAFAAVLGLATMAPLACFADPVPGLIKALDELSEAYQTFVIVKGAIVDAESKIKQPSTDFSGAANKYQSAERAVTAIQFPPEPTPPNGPQVAPVTSCAARTSVISTLSAGISGIQASLDAIKSENSQLDVGMQEIRQTRDTAVQIEKALPNIIAIPIWGEPIGADIRAMVQKVREAVGNAEDSVLRRMRHNGIASEALRLSLVPWRQALNQAEQFSNAPTPPGSYTLSCNTCSHDCEQLVCTCRRINGSFVRTEIDYPSCHSIENANGRLRCGP